MPSSVTGSSIRAGDALLFERLNAPVQTLTVPYRISKSCCGERMFGGKLKIAYAPDSNSKGTSGHGT